MCGGLRERGRCVCAALVSMQSVVLPVSGSI